MWELQRNQICRYMQINNTGISSFGKSELVILLENMKSV